MSRPFNGSSYADIKFLSNSFIQPSYPYNLENSFGSMPSTSAEDSKPQQGLHIKEEIGKELPSPDSLKQVTR